MTDTQRPLRLWPGVLIVALQLFLRFVLPTFYPDAMLVGVAAGFFGGPLVLVWWVFFSRAPRLDRYVGALFIIAAIAATPLILDKSLATGMMGYLSLIYSVPVVSFALVASAALTRGLSDVPRRTAMAAAILAACGVFSLLRTDGIMGSGTSQFTWRWTPTAEQQLLAAATLPTPAPEPVAAPTPEPAAPKPETAAPVKLPEPTPLPTLAEWPGFRGPARDSIVSNLRIATDWASAKPAELWRRPVGPGWSSFAVYHNRLYTQEQRGEEEVVTCYDAATGNPIWAHRDATRFWESNGGAGPRATPTLHNGRVYTFGATGILNALDARTGAVVWTRNVAAETKEKVPGWGFSSSPLIAGNLVLIAAAGRMAAYDLATGAPRWMGPAAGGGYSSPHLFTASGVPQVLLTSDQGTISYEPSGGAVLWKHPWPNGAPIVQPAITPDGDLLISSGDSSGIRRLHVANGSGKWTVEERWSTNGLKPYFNDFVIHEGHAYGFDGNILSCIDLKDGKRKWKGGRYGNGQLLLLRDQGLLLVLSEEGELALVRAEPGQFTEVARTPALEGKTWNHPVVVGERLFVRNSEEMVALRVGR